MLCGTKVLIFELALAMFLRANLQMNRDSGIPACKEYKNQKRCLRLQFYQPFLFYSLYIQHLIASQERQLIFFRPWFVEFNGCHEENCT